MSMRADLIFTSLLLAMTILTSVRDGLAVVDAQAQPTILGVRGRDYVIFASTTVISPRGTLLNERFNKESVVGCVVGCVGDGGGEEELQYFEDGDDDMTDRSNRDVDTDVSVHGGCFWVPDNLSGYNALVRSKMVIEENWQLGSASETALVHDSSVDYKHHLVSLTCPDPSIAAKLKQYVQRNRADRIINVLRGTTDRVKLGEAVEVCGDVVRGLGDKTCFMVGGVEGGEGKRKNFYTDKSDLGSLLEEGREGEGKGEEEERGKLWVVDNTSGKTEVETACFGPSSTIVNAVLKVGFKGNMDKVEATKVVARCLKEIHRRGGGAKGETILEGSVVFIVEKGKKVRRIKMQKFLT